MTAAGAHISHMLRVPRGVSVTRDWMIELLVGASEADGGWARAHIPVAKRVAWEQVQAPHHAGGKACGGSRPVMSVPTRRPATGQGSAGSRVVLSVVGGRFAMCTPMSRFDPSSLSE
jgi:hypothetical protein